MDANLPEYPKILLEWKDSGVVALSILAMFMMAIWGGTAAYIAKLKKSRSKFSFTELVGEWTISGFIGVVVGISCLRLAGWDAWVATCAAGMVGHMGTRAIGLFENWWARKLDIPTDSERKEP